MDLILKNTFFETHMVGVRCKPVRFEVCWDGNDVTLELTKTPMMEGCKLNLVLIDQMTNEQMVVLVWMDQL